MPPNVHAIALAAVNRQGPVLRLGWRWFVFVPGESRKRWVVVSSVGAPFVDFIEVIEA